MNIRDLIISLPSLGLALVLASCDGGGGSIAQAPDHEGHDHAEECDDHEGHDHEEVEHIKDPGPNGGRILVELEPHLELLVTGDNRLRITQLDSENAPATIGEQVATAVLGERANPTQIKFVRDGDGLLSDVGLPEGEMNPIVLSIKDTPDSGETHRLKFVLNLMDCPTCDYLEYACICDHEHEGEH